jgi:hypothetical protein
LRVGEGGCEWVVVKVDGKWQFAYILTLTHPPSPHLTLHLGIVLFRSRRVLDTKPTMNNEKNLCILCKFAQQHPYTLHYVAYSFFHCKELVVYISNILSRISIPSSFHNCCFENVHRLRILWRTSAKWNLYEKMWKESSGQILTDLLAETWNLWSFWFQTKFQNKKIIITFTPARWTRGPKRRRSFIGTLLLLLSSRVDFLVSSVCRLAWEAFLIRCTKTIHRHCQPLTTILQQVQLKALIHDFLNLNCAYSKEHRATLLKWSRLDRSVLLWLLIIFSCSLWALLIFLQWLSFFLYSWKKCY